MRIARFSLVVGCAFLAVAWCWWALATFTELIPEGRPSLTATLFVYSFFLGHLAAFFATTTGTVYGISGLVRSPETRRAGSYFVVGITALLWIVLCLIILAIPRLGS